MENLIKKFRFKTMHEMTLLLITHHSLLTQGLRYTKFPIQTYNLESIVRTQDMNKQLNKEYRDA